MIRSRVAWILGLAILSAPIHARGQAPTSSGENPFSLPELRMYWNPEVGAGAVYEVTAGDGKKHNEEYVILSASTIDGKKAYWLQITVDSPAIKGNAVEKALVIPDGFQVRKVIGQLPGMSAMDMPAGSPIAAPKPDPKTAPKLIGTESITVPGGTFECEHWKNADGSELWLGAKVGPMKLVKSADAQKHTTRQLVKIVSHAKDGVSGPVKAYDPEAIKKFIETQSQ